MIIDTSNAPCGPGFLPGLRLSEGRSSINRKRGAPAPLFLRGWGCRRRRASVPQSEDGVLAGVPPVAAAETHVRPLPLLLAVGAQSPPPSPRWVVRGCRWSRRVLPKEALSSPPRCPRKASRRPKGVVRGGARLRRAREAGQSGEATGLSAPALRCAILRPRAATPHPVRVSLGRSGRATPPPPPPCAVGTLRLRPQIRRDNPLNLSILLSGGKETNQDSLSSGERRGKSPAPNPRPTGGRGTCGVQKTAFCPASFGGLSPSDRGSARGRCEAGNGPRRAGVRSSRSRVVWECSPKRVVNSI